MTLSQTISLSSVLGHFGMWAIRQSPYNAPIGLTEALISLKELLKDDFKDGIENFPMLQCTSKELKDLLSRCLAKIDQVQQWNKSKNNPQVEYVIVSRYGSPSPDDDFIDIDALIMNIAHSVFDEE